MTTSRGAQFLAIAKSEMGRLDDYKAWVLNEVRHGPLSVDTAAQLLRKAGCFEAEIAEALS